MIPYHFYHDDVRSTSLSVTKCILLHQNLVLPSNFIESKIQSSMDLTFAS